MVESQNENLSFGDLVGYEEWRTANHQFTRAGYPAGPAGERERGKLLYA